MTTICSDTRSMAGDSKTHTSDLHFPSCKIFRIGTAIVGGAGDSADIDAWLEWLRIGQRGRKPDIAKDSDFAALYLDTSGLYQVTFDCRPTPVDNGMFAVGTGAMAAMAAMRCGKSPKEAVEIACEIDNMSGPPVHELTLKKRR